VKASQTVARIGCKRKLKYCSSAEGNAAKCHVKYRGMDSQSSVKSFKASCRLPIAGVGDVEIHQKHMRC